MTALFNTAGKDTAERLTRLEAALIGARPTAPHRQRAEPVEAPQRPPAAAKRLIRIDESEEDRQRFGAMLTALSMRKQSSRQKRCHAGQSG